MKIDDLQINFDKLHTTSLGEERIKRNLSLHTENVTEWCKNKIENASDIKVKGKNFYICVNGVVITVNSHSFTIITAHKLKTGAKQKGVEVKMTHKITPKAVLLQFVEAFNLADVEKLASLYAENAVNHQIANNPVVGKTAIRKMFELEFATADMTCIVENIFEDGEWAIMEWRDPLGLRGCGFFQIQEDKIVFQRGYWDKLSFLKQHNLPLE